MKNEKENAAATAYCGSGVGVLKLLDEANGFAKVPELIPQRVEIDLKRYEELVRKETILDILARCLFTDNLYMHEKEYRAILGEYGPSAPKEPADE